MRTRFWMPGLLFLLSSSLWSGYVISERAFLRDFNAGVHAYLAGDFRVAEESLGKALDRRPGNEKAHQLLSKVFIERSFSQYHQKDYKGALETLDRASLVVGADEQTRQALSALRQQLSVPVEQRPVNMEEVLAGLYQHLPEQTRPNNMEALMDQWFKRTQSSQEELLKRFWNNQEDWLLQLQKEKEQFKKILYGGLVLFGLGGLVMVALLAGMLHAYFGRRGVFARLLDEHYRRLVSALPAGSRVLLGPPVSLHRSSAAQQLDVIEAEISTGQNEEEAARRLHMHLEGEDPWVRARAAKILYQLDPQLSIQELKRLVTDASSGTQVPGMWALAELGTSEALDLLVPLVYSPSKEIEQGAIRSLLQLQSKEELPEDVRQKLNKLLGEIRSRTGWVF